MEKHSRNLVMAFDTETSGFPPKINRSGGAPVPPISEYPLILQLSFVIYDLDAQSVVQEYNQYVKIADDAVIPERTTEIQGLTKQICNLRGIPMEEKKWKVDFWTREKFSSVKNKIGLQNWTCRPISI